MPENNRRPARDTGGDDVVGLDRNAKEVAARLARGGSVVVVGELGTGKSHLSRAVITQLRERGLDPVLVRGARPLASTPFGALQAVGDRRLAPLIDRNDEPADGPPLVLVVDDAHTLDDDSLRVITDAVYDGRVRALLSITSAPTSAHPTTMPPAVAALWLDGLAERHDLQQLDDEVADALITSFVGEHVLDSVARAVITVRSAGSRMLLREFALDAVEAVRRGEDPLDPRRAPRAGSRLSDAIRTVVSEYTEEECLGLALTGRLTGIEFTTLSRVVAPEALDALLRRRAVRTDGGPQRLLYPNGPLALEAERQLPAGLLDATLDALITEALSGRRGRPSEPVMRVTAAAWHEGRAGVPGPDDVDHCVRVQVLSTAARSANAEGRADLALAYVEICHEEVPSPALQLQVSRAHARLRRFDLAYAALSGLDATTMPTDDLRRVVRWWSTLIGWQPLGRDFAEIDEWLAAGGVTDPSVLCELAEQRAEAAYLEMDWTEAAQRAAAVLNVREAHVLVRLRAAIVAAMALGQLGRGRAGVDLLITADRLNRDPVTGNPVSVLAELALICFQAVTGLIADAIPPGLEDRLRQAVSMAAQRKDRSGLVLSGMVSGVVLGFARGDDHHSDREFEAALGRVDRIEFAVFRPLIAHLRASALARLGQPDQARAVIDDVDIEQLNQHRLFRYSRRVAEFDVALADGDFAGAEAALLGAEDERAAGDPSSAPSLLEELRMAALLQALERGSGPHLTAVPALAEPEPRELTEREHEVALLVARRLSNKEIAQQLYLSVRTVESHIYAARGKLGAGSRRELGLLVAETEGRRH
ncbi:LuxR C-terminal-related transcriptional regulator [Herbiconiux sp. P18]